MLNDLKISAVVIMRKTLVKKMLFAGSMHVLGHVKLPIVRGKQKEKKDIMIFKIKQIKES